MCWTVVCLLLLALPLSAAEVDQVNVHREGDQYQLQVIAHVDAQPTVVWALLTDFDNLQQLHPMVRASTYLRRTPEGADRVRIRTRPCVLLFCVDFTQIVEFRAFGEERLQGDFDPRDSHFHFGQLRWQLEGISSGGTDLRFDAELTPAFWLPPLLGSWVLKRALRTTATDIVMNLDRLSRS
ncbi:MAG: SRPBCC family protein [Gammaproteobacteria bacterium]